MKRRFWRILKWTGLLHTQIYEENEWRNSMSSKSRNNVTKEMREFIPILQKNGFVYARSKGSHFTYINRVSHKTITVNKNLNPKVRGRLIKENNLEV